MVPGRTKAQNAAMTADDTEAIHKRSAAPRGVLTVGFPKATRGGRAAAGTLMRDHALRA